MSGATIELRFTDVAAERRFIESFLSDAWDRYETSEYWEHGWYWSYGQFAEYDVGPDGGLVRLVFEGEPDELRAAETSRWNAFDGLTGWTIERYDDAGFDSLLAQQQAVKGDLGGTLEYQYKPLTSELALAVHEAFDESLPPAPEAVDGNPAGIGMWSLVHSLYVQCGYDWYEENDASLQALRSRVKSLGSYRGAREAREEYERLLDAWREFESALDAWLDDHPTGDRSI